VAKFYTPKYSRNLGRVSRRTASVVVPLVIDLVRPGSVIDVGCGTGSWLAEFRKAGITDVLGLDGNWIRRDQLEIPVGQFQPTDLMQRFRVPRAFDLACCLEVAEHLPPDRARTFVGNISTLAPHVLFSAAIPFQGGTHHVNEQWPDYWQALFSDHGYHAIDCFRSRLWENPAVQPYVAQNLWLYVAPMALVQNERLQAEQRAIPRFPTRVIHPGIYEAVSYTHLTLPTICSV